MHQETKTYIKWRQKDYKNFFLLPWVRAHFVPSSGEVSYDSGKLMLEYILLDFKAATSLLVFYYLEQTPPPTPHTDF